MALRTWEFTFNNRNYRATYESSWYNLPSGARMSDRFPYDPVFNKEIGLDTREKIADFFLMHRDELFEWISISACENTIFNCSRYFDRYESALKLLKTKRGLLSRTLQAFQSNGYHTVENIMLRFYLRGTRSTNRPYLIDQPQDTGSDYIDCSLRIDWDGWAEIHSSSTYSSRIFDNGTQERWIVRHNYTYNMNPSAFQFFRTTPKDTPDEVMFGMELEISTRLSFEEIQYIVTDVEPKQEPFFIFKHDGSVTGMYDNKVEIVTVPCTPRYLRREWKTFFTKLEKLCAAKGQHIENYFDTCTSLNNGLHIHISKNSFYDDSHMRKFLALWNRTDTALMSFIDRLTFRPRRYWENGYCSPDTRVQGQLISSILKGRHHFSQRGSCHEVKSATVEVRVFQGIFDLHHICRSIDLVDATFRFTNNTGLRSIFGKTTIPFESEFTKFVFGQPGLTDLKKELKACA